MHYFFNALSSTLKITLLLMTNKFPISYNFICYILVLNFRLLPQSIRASSLMAVASSALPLYVR